jgi:hypothetical protein
MYRDAMPKNSPRRHWGLVAALLVAIAGVVMLEVSLWLALFGYGGSNWFVGGLIAVAAGCLGSWLLTPTAKATKQDSGHR